MQKCIHVYGQVVKRFTIKNCRIFMIGMAYLLVETPTPL